MKRTLRKILPMLLMACVLAMTAGVTVSCKSSEQTMYERKQSNRGNKVKSNIKVKGNNKTNGHTTRSY